MIKQNIHNFLTRFNQIIPIKTLLSFIFGWVILLSIYRVFLFDRGLDTPIWFPSSVVEFNGLHLSGIVFFLLFWHILIPALINLDRSNEWYIVLKCWLLIIFGNLIQGSYKLAFLKPFYGAGNQYYDDSLNVPNVLEWLASVNTNQTQLSMHGRTHPPFAILIHDFFLVISGYKVEAIAIGFAMISLFSIPLLLIIFKTLKLELANRKLLLLLFSILPAVNIYSIVCLDGIILTTSTLFLLGLVMLRIEGKNPLPGIVLIIAGTISTNFLTFGGLYLFGVLGIIALFDLFKKKNKTTFYSLIISIVVFLGCVLALKFFFNYDHIKGFLTASHIENPDGFLLFSNPLIYLLSRVEGISEIAFYLSFPVLVYLIALRKNSQKKYRWFEDKSNLLITAGGFMLVLMLISGAFRTGETARCCLFFYPYLLLLLTDLRKETLPWLVITAGLQTSLMQLFCNFYW